MRVLRIVLSLFVLTNIGWGLYEIWLNSGEHAQVLVLVAVTMAHTNRVVFAYAASQSVYHIVDAIVGAIRDRSANKTTSPPSEAV
jgi:hypothetical protein